MTLIGTVAPGLAKIHNEQLAILDRVESRGKLWKQSERDRFASLDHEWRSLAKIAETFALLDEKHFNNRLSAAGVTVELADLSHDGADGSYFIAASVIRLSRRLAPEDIGKVLLHELGHAACHVIDGYDGPANSHGREFQHWCSRLGESYGLAPPMSSGDAARWPFSGGKRESRLTAEEKWQRAKEATLNPH